MSIQSAAVRRTKCGNLYWGEYMIGRTGKHGCFCLFQRRWLVTIIKNIHRVTFLQLRQIRLKVPTVKYDSHRRYQAKYIAILLIIQSALYFAVEFAYIGLYLFPSG